MFQRAVKTALLLGVGVLIEVTAFSAAPSAGAARLSMITSDHGGQGVYSDQFTVVGGWSLSLSDYCTDGEIGVSVMQDGVAQGPYLYVLGAPQSGPFTPYASPQQSSSWSFWSYSAKPVTITLRSSCPQWTLSATH